MPHLSGAGAAIGHTVLSSRTSAEHALGAKYETKDGRTYRYVKAGGAALVVGNMIQGPAQVADHDSLAVAANAAIGATRVTVTLGATGVTAQDYAGGFLLVDTTPGEGYSYRISSHPTAANAASCVITLEAEDGLQVALTTASTVTLVKNPYNGVIQTPITTLTGPCVGAAVYPIPLGEYGWVQSRGVAAVLIAGTPGVGQAVVVPGTSAGCVVVDGATAPTHTVGTMIMTGVAGKILPVNLNI